MEAFVSFMQCSTCPLETLDIRASFGDSLDLISMLKAVPHLTGLHIEPSEHSGVNFTSGTPFKHISQTFNPAHSEDTFLPVLEFFGYSPYGPRDYEIVCNLIPDLFGITECTSKESGNNIDDSSRRTLAEFLPRPLPSSK